MSQILRLPAPACRHYVRGRCDYEEVLNPGYDPEYRCRVLVRLQQVYDTFLAQADAFDLDESKATGIWEKRFREVCSEDTGCQEYEPDDTNSYPGCALCLGDVCVFRLPECGGRCRNYTPKPRG